MYLYCSIKDKSTCVVQNAPFTLFYYDWIIIPDALTCKKDVNVVAGKGGASFESILWTVV